jgi:C4-dicarboxylate transporter, DctM subunit
MEKVVLTVLVLTLLFGLLGSGVWIAFALTGIGYAIIAAYSSAPAGPVLASTIWGASYS